MKCKLIKIKGDWKDVYSAAMTTIGSEAIKSPPSSWKKRILLCEHSPIRQLLVKAKWYGLKSWISVHLVRHWLGIVHWVKSQRPDRQKFTVKKVMGIMGFLLRLLGRQKDTIYNRDELPQGALVEHEIEANAQAIINISRRRLCYGNPSTETREAWQSFVESFKTTETELYSVCVPECVYRNGICPEFKTCGFNKTESFNEWRTKYIKGIESQVSR